MFFKLIILGCLISATVAGKLVVQPRYSYQRPEAAVDPPSYEYPKPDPPQPAQPGNGYIPPSDRPLTKPAVVVALEPETWEPANYEFQYEVHAEETGDIKRQQEKAVDGKVTGEYSLVEPDGLHRRVVRYTADDENGFVAIVTLEPWNGGSHQPQISPSYIPPPPPVQEPSNGYIPPSRRFKF